MRGRGRDPGRSLTRCGRAGTAARVKDSAFGDPPGRRPEGPRGRRRTTPPRTIQGARSWRGIADPGSEAGGGALRRQRP